MKVGVIIDMLDEKKTGVGNHISKLVENLPTSGTKSNYTLIHHDMSLIAPFDKNTFATLIVNTPKIPLGSVIRKILLLPRKINKQNFDVVHDTYQLGPLFIKGNTCSKVVTVYDITPILYPALNPIVNIRHRILLPRVLYSVDKIITISECTKKDIVKFYKIPEDKIKVIPLAPDPIYQPLSRDIIAPILSKYGVCAPYILYVGSLEPRKNIQTLIQGFANIKKRGLNHKLIIVGNKKWEYSKLIRIVAESGLHNDVIFTGYLPDEDLPALYNGADLFVYPSLYEGFGLPPLEAMACGTPVITSSTSSLPEVVGNAGIMVDPQDLDQLSDAIYHVLTDENLRLSLIEKGLERSKQFSWERTATETCKVYDEVAAQPKCTQR